MLLEEILPYIRKGHHPTFNGIKCESLHHRLMVMSDEANILSDKWGYLPKYVGFNEAWAHMVIGNNVVKNGRTYQLDALRNALCVGEHGGGGISAGWYRLSGGIPIDWIDATDFELVED